MRKETTISINEEDLKFIVQEEFEQIVDLAKHNSYCRNCFQKNKVEMINYSLALNDLNDVIFQGTCKTCGSNIARYVEIGEQPKFRMRTEIIKAKRINKN